MKTPFTLLLPLLLVLAATAAGATDETRFVPKNYSGQPYRDNDYKPKSYTPAQALRNTEYRESPDKRSFWGIFRKKELTEPKMLQNIRSSDDKLFTRLEQEPLPVKRPDEKPVTDGSYESSADLPADQKFVPDNRPRARDPLLAPRQGIKAPAK